MLVSKLRPDNVLDSIVEFPDGTKAIPKGHSFTLPPEIPEGHYAKLSPSGWILIEGDAPEYSQSDDFSHQSQLYKIVIERTQERLDAFARSRGYYNIMSACTYATSSVEKFKIEGQYCVNYRDTIWNRLYEILNEIESGKRPAPIDYADIESELPNPAWPTV